MRRIVACCFGADPTGHWGRLARVFMSTAERQCPGWIVALQALPTPPASSARASYVANSVKLDHWCAEVARAPDGDELLLIDADTALLRPLDAVWQDPFDVAYTVRAPGYRYPLNGGVVFVRVSAPTRAWITAWREENHRFLRDDAAFRPYKTRFAGLNQAALGAILEQPVSRGLALRALPCLEWNCEDSTWSQFDPAVTRILHIKSGLRRAIFNLAPPAPVHRPLMAIWRDLERRAGTPRPHDQPARS